MQSVMDWLNKKGIPMTQVDPEQLLLQINAQAAEAERACQESSRKARDVETHILAHWRAIGRMHDGESLVMREIKNGASNTLLKAVEGDMRAMQRHVTETRARTDEVVNAYQHARNHAMAQNDKLNDLLEQLTPLPQATSDEPPHPADTVTPLEEAAALADIEAEANALQPDPRKEDE